MPLHESTEILLRYLDDAGLFFDADTTPEVRRAAMSAATTNPNVAKHPCHQVFDRTIPGPAGDIPVRVFRPSDEVGLPLIIWFHGGGFVTGDLDTHDQLGRMLAGAVPAIVMTPAYRLAPEAKFPAATDDCFATYEWAIAHAGEIGADPKRVAIGGDSAGGNLTTVTALAARDQGVPLPSVQVLVYPVTDCEFDSPSMTENAKGYFLEAETMRWFWDHYARTPDDFADPRFSPLRAPDLDGLPPAVVITAEYDPLRDQGIAYARRLQDAGVPTTALAVDGVVHGFFGLHDFMPPAREPWDVCVAAFRAALEVR
jgi:acetyl esterase